MDPPVEQLRARLRAELPALAARYRVASLGLFGSRRRGDHRPDSDLDILVTFADTPGLFRLAELEGHLSDLLGLRVDLVTPGALKPVIGETILSELMPV